MAGKYRLSTLGCKVNQYESEQVRELLEACGLRPAEPGEIADLAIVNTCAVTCGATAKSRQTLRKHARNRAKQTIAMGCYATADPDAIKRIAGVCDVLGHDTDTLARLKELIAEYGMAAPASANPPPDSGTRPPAAGRGLVRLGLSLERTAQVAPPGAAFEREPDPASSTTDYSMSPKLPIVNAPAVFPAPIHDFAHRTRAFLKVQDGCDAHCSYCIIPRLRTRVGYKPVERVVAEAQRLVASGHREIVLTGIFLGAYGRETALRKRFARGPSPLAKLIEALGEVVGLDRLRLSSLEPGDVDDALLEVLSGQESCVPHLHLPLQAGSGEILRRMNRQYTIDDFQRMIARVHAAFDRPAISTDIIVGFPGETDALFEETLAVARASGFCKIHAFPFSPRPGTAAAKWKSQFVHPQTVKDRMATLAQIGRELGHTYETQFVGETQRVLVEGTANPSELRALAREPGNPTCTPEARMSPRRSLLVHGRTDRYFEVYFAARDLEPGALVQVRIDRVSPTRVHGSLDRVAE